MPTNDFKAFAIGGGANVIGQGTYEALDALDTGFQSGIANSDELNKVWRQASVWAQVLGDLTAAGQSANVVDDGDVSGLLAQLTTALKALMPYSGYVTTTNSGNAYAATLAGTYALTNKFTLFVKFPNVNSADGPTLNLNGLGAKTIYLKDFTTTLPKGQLPIEGILSFHNDLDGWVLVTEPAAGGYAVDSNTSANAITVQIPGIRAYFDGLRIDFKCKTTCTGATTINVTGLGAKNIKYQGAALSAGQLVAGRFYRVCYNSVTDEFQLISPPG
jgi:hypothetical protein